MIDYEGLHKQIKAKLNPDSLMPEGWKLWPPSPNSDEDYIAIKYMDGLPVNGCPCFTFKPEFGWTPPACIEWFANALGIPLEDNGYTDLVLAAELQLSITREWHEVKTDDEVEAWSDSASDGEIAIRAALERIKNETNE